MDALALIAKRRDGLAHTREELQLLAEGAARGTVPDYQLSAWLMAAYLNPLTEDETAWFTLAMAESGERVDLTGLPKPWVDKHSTGGVGDKTTLVLLPLLAACGLTVVKMSGRGLGVTGGTVDKLASVPGFRLDLSPEEMKAQAARIGLALTGQTPNLAPADKALYALRDATATVTSMPLIVSSVLSKKIAGGAETVVLDVKYGSGAFMTSLGQARELRRWLLRIGRLAGLKVKAEISYMDQPLGSAVGNALEVIEAIRVLRNEPLAPNVGRFRELCLSYAALALEACGIEPEPTRARAKVEAALASGQALEKARHWFAAQGAQPAVLDQPETQLPSATIRLTVEAQADGWIGRVDARCVGEVAIDLGAGRTRKEDEVDPSVGIEVLVQVGDQVRQGQPLITIHAATEAAAEQARQLLIPALEITVAPVEPRPLFVSED